MTQRAYLDGYRYKEAGVLDVLRRLKGVPAALDPHGDALLALQLRPVSATGALAASVAVPGYIGSKLLNPVPSAASLEGSADFKELDKPTDLKAPQAARITAAQQARFDERQPKPPAAPPTPTSSVIGNAAGGAAVGGLLGGGLSLAHDAKNKRRAAVLAALGGLLGAGAGVAVS